LLLILKERHIMERLDGRRADQLRPVRITPGYLPHAEGSALIEQGGTVVLCAASVEDRLPLFLRDKGSGWVTAEYGMLPRSTHTRTPREAAQGRVGGRTQEIQRLIGRALRAVTRLDLLGERTFTLDCDVIQADAGTRCAAITGSYVALYQAFQKLLENGNLSTLPIRDALAAVSVGVVDGVPLLDLTYEEDSRADADFNIVQTASGEFVEIQGSAESAPFPRETLEEVLRLAAAGIGGLLEAQKAAIASIAPRVSNE
jgi:ribonuclease PH